jgi:hypothetical protein
MAKRDGWDRTKTVEKYLANGRGRRCRSCIEEDEEQSAQRRIRKAPDGMLWFGFWPNMFKGDNAPLELA